LAAPVPSEQPVFSLRNAPRIRRYDC